MAFRAAVMGSALALVVRAAQPGAAHPKPAPMRELQWGQLNFLHTTDTHGWHAGHIQESQYSADWGDYVSFAAHMRKRADDEGRDLLVVDTGDRVEGNGLYDSSSPKGKYYYDIYKQQHVDVICIGNHELYQATTADMEYERTVPNFHDRYIASNLDYIDPETGDQVPMAQRYRKFQTKNQKINITAFGFIFDFTGNANNTVLQPVRDAIQEQWFQRVIREKPDLFLVIGHVGVRMQEFQDIFTAIRKQDSVTPIVFFGGHVHVRDAAFYDSKSFAMASGRYMETIGWMSLDGLANGSEDVSTAAVTFSRRYIDNNLLGLYHHTGLNETTFPTEHGTHVTQMIAQARKELDLDHTYGCAPQDLWVSRVPAESNSSLFTWLQNEVLPDITVREDRADVPRLSVMNTGAMRFDIFKGPFTRDTTYTISPFVSKLAYIKHVPYDLAARVLPLINNADKIFSAAQLDTKLLVMPEQWKDRRPSTVPAAAAALGGFDSQRPLGKDREGPELIAGYTTEDDIGIDGDDALHTPIEFFSVPNCIQSKVGFPAEGEPETVDLVFFDYVQPYVLLALNFSGGDYAVGDVEPYLPETFTELMTGWIAKNWPAKC